MYFRRIGNRNHAVSKPSSVSLNIYRRTASLFRMKHKDIHHHFEALTHDFRLRQTPRPEAHDYTGLKIAPIDNWGLNTPTA